MSGSGVASGVDHSVADEPSRAGLPSKGKSESHGAVRETRVLRGGEAVDGLRLGTPECAEAQLRVSEGMISNESHVRETRTLGLMSAERGIAVKAKTEAPAPGRELLANC